MSNLTFEVDTDGVAVITLDDPQRAMNVTSPELTAELMAAFERVKTSPEIRGAVLTSGKENCFVAGGDIKDFVTAYDRGMTQQEAFALSNDWNVGFRRVETCGKPIAAAINGLALGGGFELTLCCHYRVLVDNPRAVVGLPEVTIGLLPAGGGTQRLPRLIGIERALPLMLEGRLVNPAEALKLGMVHAVVPREQVLETARRWVLANPLARQPWDIDGYRLPGRVSPASDDAMQFFMAETARMIKLTRSNYPAPLALLSAVQEGMQLPIDLGLAVESRHSAMLLTGVVARNLMRTMFVNKGLADKLARRPTEVPISRVTKLAVLGTGVMGVRIAHASAAAGIDVVLVDVGVDAADNAKKHLAHIVRQDGERGSMSGDKTDALLARIRPTPDYADLDGCDLIVEAMPTNREVKADAIARAEAGTAPTAIVASSTATLPITGLAHVSTRPEQFIGIHCFPPVDKGSLVEIVAGSKTGRETIARVMDYVRQIKKTPIIVNDSPGFYVNRVFISFVAEGMCMLAEGIEPALIERAAAMAGMPAGPLAAIDEAGLGLQREMIRQMEPDGQDDRARLGSACKVIERMTQDLGRPGRCSGAGFYDYPPGGAAELWPGLKVRFPPSTEQSDVEEIRQRLLYIQALESARCLEEGVVMEPADADLGAVLGVGFPTWTGGTLSFIETVGLERFVAECESMAARYGQRFHPSSWLVERARRGQKFYGAIKE